MLRFITLPAVNLELHFFDVTSAWRQETPSPAAALDALRRYFLTA
jgi:hypothetical protein